MGGRDGTKMSDIETPERRPGIDRRTLIKRAAATGAVAWTAPLIIDSLSSPAAALTCTGNCFLVQFPPAGTAGGANCNVSSQTVGTGTQAPCPNLSSSNCGSTTSISAGFTIASLCLSSTDCRAATAAVTFTLNTTSTTCFTATQTTCVAPRRILAAQAKSATGPGVPTCNTGTISATGTTATFTKAAGTSWVWFQLLVGCGCS